MRHAFFYQRKEELTLSTILLFIYLAFFSGHYYSIDGMVVFRQARSIYEDHSLIFKEPIEWGYTISTSKYGIGLSLTYLPGLALFSFLRDDVYHASEPFDWGLLYLDPLYSAAGAPVHIIFTVITAYIVGRFCRKLGVGSLGIFWSMLLFGVGSPAIVYSRGDYSQPLLSLCWIASLYYAFSLQERMLIKNALFCAIAVSFGILTRFLEGLLILPAVFLLFSRTEKSNNKKRVTIYGIVILGIAIALLITFYVNFLRFGNWLKY